MDGEFACAINKDLGYSEFTHFMINSSITMLAIDEVIEKVDEWTKIRGRDTTFLVGPGSSYVKPEPLGLSLVVGAWNYPLFTLLP
jgi:aldehyde dehydrogenase (NAD+)